MDTQTLGLAGKDLAPGAEASSDNKSPGVSTESALYSLYSEQSNSIISLLLNKD